MSLISLSDFAGSKSLEDGTLRSLVVDGHRPEVLAETADIYGAVNSASLGVVVAVDPASGQIKGSSMRMVGRDNAEIISLSVPCRSIWPKADRRLTLTLTVGVDDVEFPVLAEPAGDNKGLTEWLELGGHEGAVVKDGAAVLEKHGWGDKGLTEACFRLAIVPTSAKEAVVYVQVVPMGLEDLKEQAKDTGIGRDRSEVVAIKLKGHSVVKLVPGEQPAHKANMGLLPFIYAVTEEIEGMALPPTDELRRELWATLRAVSVPRATDAKNFDSRAESDVWPPADVPPIRWPEAPVPDTRADEGETCKLPVTIWPWV